MTKPPTYALLETRPAKLTREGVEYVARIWATPTGIFVKTHTRKLKLPFGTIGWAITGAVCDAGGKALTGDDAEPLVHDRAHNYQIASEGAGSIEEASAKIRADFETQHKFVVAKIERMGRDLEVARATGL